jgi:hypothetical protein
MSTHQWQYLQVVDTLIPAAYGGWTPWGCFPILKVGQMVWPIVDVKRNPVYLTTTRPRTAPGGFGWLGDVNGCELYVDRPARVVSTNPITTRTLE